MLNLIPEELACLLCRVYSNNLAGGQQEAGGPTAS